MKNRQKMIIWLMLVALLLSEITHLVSISNQVVWAQEGSETLKSTETQEKTTSTETSVNQIQSEETTEASQIQAQISSQQEENEVLSKTQTSTEKTVAESSIKEEVASQISKTSIQPQAGNVDDNPGAKVAYKKAVDYWIGEIYARVKAAPKLGNYTGATSIIEFKLPVENAHVTSATSGMYKWDYATSIYFENMSFIGGDGITFTGSASVSSTNGKQFNYFYLVIKRTKPGSNITIPSISLSYHGELRADEYSKSPFNGEYVWNRVDYFEKGVAGIALGGLVCDLESIDMPSKYSWFYDEWRKISVQKIASNLSGALKSNYSKLGKNVNDTVNFTVESKASERYTGQINFIGDYFSDLSQFKVDLSSNFSAYVQLEKTGSTGTKINYRMKRVKAGNFSGDCSVTITTRHDAEGRTISIYDGSFFDWALPMDNIPLDSVSASFNINDDRQIWADVVEQTIELGTWSGEIPDVSKMITNVRLEDGTAIDSSDYTAEITSVPSFDNMMITDKIGVKITRKSNGAVTYLQVPVKMSWGNTIQLRGYDNGTSGAYTLHKVGNSYYIRSSYGENKNYRSKGIHEYRKGMTYQSITLLRGTGRIDQLSSTYYKGFNGEITTNEVVNSFGTNAQQYVQLGDVVQIWHKEQWRNSYTRNGSNVKYSDMDEGNVYFAVTADGFIPYCLNRLKPKETTITITTTNEELDKQAGDLIDFLGMSGNGLKVSKITEYPDRSKAGTAQGKVLVEETIDDHTYTYEYEVPFKVKDDRQIWADVVEQTIELGTWSGEIPDVSKMITNVRLEDGATIDSSDYTAEITSVPSFDNMMVTDKIGVKITRKSNGAVTYLQVPVKMTMGNTIQIRGVGDYSAGAFTLHKVANGYYLRATYGQGYTSPSGIHDYFAGTYYSIRLLRGSGLINQLTQTYSQGFNGSLNISNIISQFGTNSQQFVQLGDIVEIWHEEQNRNSYFKGEKESKYFAENNKVVYFAVTADGFIPYRLNQLKPKETTITTTTTNEELDKQAGDLIDFLGMSGNGLKVSKITEYPDRSKAGTAKGKVLVEETIDGHTYTYEYQVTFNVLNDLNVSAKQIVDIPLGTTLSNEAKEYVTVTSAPEDEGKLTFEWVGEPISASTVGTHQAVVRVTSPTFSKSVDVTIDYEVLYGNSIVMGTDPSVALSLLDDGGKPKLAATPGTPKEKLSLRSSISIYRHSLVNLLTLLKTDTVYQKPEQLAENWNSLITKQSYSYGDVLVVSAYKRDDPSWSLQGSETYVSRNEILVKESEGYDDAFYELTPTGYSLLHINRLTPEIQEIEQGTSEEELDKRVSEFLSIKNYNNIQVKKFSMYPDTSKVGGSTSIITVSETLKSGGTFEYQYPVSFLVKAPNLTLTTNLSVTNLSRTEEETKVGDELLYSYTLTNDSPIGILKTGNLSVDLPEGLKAVTRSEQTIPLTELAAGETFTHQLMVKVTDQALNQNPVVKVAGKATNESTVEQEIPEATVDVPGSLVTEVDASEINITIPTKMNFGSDDKKIISPVYKMENNSTTPVEVMVDQFTPDQKLEGKNLLLNITSGNQSVTLYENEQGFNQIQSLLTLGSREIKQLSFNGSVNQQTEVSQSSSTLRLRFKSIK